MAQKGPYRTRATKPSVYPCLWPTRFSHPKVDALARRLKKIFDSLPHLGYIGAEELRDYRYYEHMIVEALVRIDGKAERGIICPLDTRDYPKILRYPHGTARVALYIGSFDPFQLTHLTIALRLLASEKNQSDMVVIVPEGAADPRKPRKTDYSFRYQISRLQLSGLFEPFVIPLDIGAGADTIEIARRFIAMHTGMKLEMTHLIGSDVLPVAMKYMDADIASWRAEALQSGVEFRHAMHVVRRQSHGNLFPLLEEIRKKGVPTVYDRMMVRTPSSTNFRDNRVITLVLPTEGIRNKLEIFFRYNMNQAWTASLLDDRDFRGRK